MNEQPELPFEPHKLRRNTDPDTSHASAESAKEVRARHHRIIMQVLRTYGAMTSEEIATACKTLPDIDYWAVARRMSELRDVGFIIQTDERRRNRSGRQAIVWRLP